ncbi:MAG: GtrA family protein [Paludibacteraceae bacterium]|nr:GtrA family protein [Paludibacteraceae bacterium]
MNRLAQIITKIIDFFYRPFQKWIPEQVFRYAACGGGNMVLDWVLYFLIYNFVIGHEIITFQFSPPGAIFNFQFAQAITPHIATLCIVFPITLLTGFWLQKYVTFTQSNLHGARQLMRYISIVAVNLAINYFGLKLCVEIFGWYPTPSKMLITLITVAVSYFGQKYYSFRVNNKS